ncbi:MAG: SAM-dependent methyltransferase [Bacteroidetes bacterium]|jgi:ubiquinone/menaquinone biosynthesis C-methylase UbiE|nr:SAM-dependent methyltransferase [Bacteroidota bacterium]
MESFDRKQHWENIYTTKELENCSWYEARPVTSLEFIEAAGISRTAKIIDIGGGDSFLADYLLEKGFSDITVLDISEASLERAKQRLGNKAHKVKWIVGDAAKFTPSEQYDLWHDRAAFHFLTDEQDVKNYVETAKMALRNEGILVIGTFSENGPKKCSGINIKQYSQDGLTNTFESGFKKLRCLNVDHPTPFNTTQNFIFCSFKKA